VIGLGVVDSSGSFAVSLVPTPEVVSLAERNGGALNLDVLAFLPSTTASLATEQVAFTHLGPSGFGAVLPLDLSFEAGRLIAPIPPSAMAASSCPYPTPPAGGGMYANVSTVDGPASIPTVVGEYHSWDGMSGHFQYGQTADSQIEAKVSIGGDPFQASGMEKISNTESSDIKFNASGRFGRQLLTNFAYVKERTGLIGCDGQTYSYSDKIRTTQWRWPGSAHGADVSQWDGPDRWAIADQKGFAEEVPANTDFSKRTGKGMLYEGAVTAFGVGLKATSGYSTNVQMYWKTGTEQPHYFFFGNDGPPSTASNVYAYSGPIPLAIDPPYQMAAPCLHCWCCWYDASWKVVVAQDPTRPLTLRWRPYSSDPVYPTWDEWITSVPQGSGLFTISAYKRRGTPGSWVGYYPWPPRGPWTAEAKVLETGATVTAVWDSPA
jgi:hypothetical protein